MDIKTSILNRRSVRKYTGEPLTEDELHAILEAGLLAPSGKNLHSTEFVTTDDPALLASLAQCRVMGSAFLKNAAAAVIVLGDHDRSDTWVEDASIALAYMQLSAADLGLGSCWIQVRNRMAAEETAEDYIRNLLNIPEHCSVLAILALGRPAAPVKPHSPADADFTRVRKAES